MISYKRDVFERQSLSEVKMGRGSPICERVHKKIVEYFKNNVPQRQIEKALQISSSSLLRKMVLNQKGVLWLLTIAEPFLVLNITLFYRVPYRTMLYRTLMVLEITFVMIVFH